LIHYFAADSPGEILSKRGLLRRISLGRLADNRRLLFGRLGQTKTINFSPAKTGLRKIIITLFNKNNIYIK
jgi:hypothetical protein